MIDGIDGIDGGATIGSGGSQKWSSDMLPSPPQSNMTSPVMAPPTPALTPALAPRPLPSQNSQNSHNSQQNMPHKKENTTHQNTLKIDASLVASLREFVPPDAPQLHAITDERDVRLMRVLKIDPQQFCRALYSAEELALQHFIQSAAARATEHKSVLAYRLRADAHLSCVNWKGRCFVTGTDIVRFLTHRYETFTGRKPANVKKFEEGVFSDLRRLSPPKDCILEGTRSDFLLFLYDYDCVRSKKKQKVFFWSSFVACYNNLFCDAIDRELARIEMAKAVGMSIEEFIKSGIVPTGSTAHEAHRRPLPFDWTVVAENRPSTADHEGHKCTPILNVDQIHYIRNDVNHLFQRHLRALIYDRTDRLSPDYLDACHKYCLKLSGPGVRVEQVVRKPDPAPRRVRGAPKEPKGSSTAAKSDHHAAGASDDSMADSQDEEYIVRGTSSRRRGGPNSPPGSVHHRRSSSSAHRRHGIPRLRRPLPELPPYDELVEHDQDGNASDTSMSSNDEDIRALYASYRYDQERLRRARGAAHPHLIHVQSSAAAHGDESGATGDGNEDGFSIRCPSEEALIRATGLLTPSMTPPPHPPTNRAEKRTLSPSHDPSQNPSQPQHQTNPEVHTESNKRMKLDGHKALIVSPGELATKPLFEYEAAYILLGINRS